MNEIFKCNNLLDNFIFLVVNSMKATFCKIFTIILILNECVDCYFVDHSAWHKEVLRRIAERRQRRQMFWHRTNGCVLGTSEITMADFSIKQIKDVQKGDKIMDGKLQVS